MIATMLPITKMTNAFSNAVSNARHPVTPSASPSRAVKAGVVGLGVGGDHVGEAVEAADVDLEPLTRDCEHLREPIPYRAAEAVLRHDSRTTIAEAIPASWES